jgi:ADP-ribosylglycohydrolase
MNRDGPAGSALHTFHIAVWSLLTANNFRDGIECAVRFGGDTDTAAAVAGSLLGARFGIEGIPAEWRQVLKGHNRMTELAQGLYTETF